MEEKTDMKKFGEFICKHKLCVFILSLVLLVVSFFGNAMTRINYDILVYIPENIETVKGQNTLTEDFNMGAFSITVLENMSPKDVLALEEKLKQIDGVNKVVSLYDVVGTTIPLEFLPSEIVDKVHQGDSDLLLITFQDSTSSESTLDAVAEIRKITKESCKVGGMSSMVLDTMELSEKEIFIYVCIAVVLCLLVLELSLDSYVVPILLLANIGFAIIFNLGSNIIFGDISYITKALVAVLQLGVTTDFSIFLYHAYEKEKGICKTKEEAMSNAIYSTFTSVTGSSLTTIAGFLVLCTMKLTLGTDLGLVMAKGVLLGVICVLTLFPSLLLIFDKWIESTRHRSIIPNFSKLNSFIIKHHIPIFIIFLIILVPAYLAYSKVDVYYKIDESLPESLESIMANEELKEKFNIVSPEIILIDSNMNTDTINEMVDCIEDLDGIEFVLSFSKLKEKGLTEDMIPDDVVSIFENEKYQMLLINSSYEIASPELNQQIKEVNDLIKKYDETAILAGEGPLMNDLVTISDQDFKSVNDSSIICVLIIMFVILKSLSLPILLILTIEFAIFTNMSVSYFGGIVLPFVAPIVLGTIQLGATIDYAILMTTTYIENRHHEKDKRKAMQKTLDYCGISIVVSGLCFFAATFGVGIYSKIDMVGSLCTLISRGAIVSMLVVLTVLPSILLIFDKIIFKTTYQGKEKKMKKVLASFLVACIAISSVPVSALTKEEIVYTKLNSDGSKKSSFVQNHLINDENLDTIEDLSNLKNIYNINSSHTFKQSNNRYSWAALGNDIFYRGTTDSKMPVTESVKYYLDGKESTALDMIGKSGKVKIEITYENHDKHVEKINGKSETLYTPFVVTTTTLISSKNNKNVEVTNGKVINNGASYVVVALSAPGLYESLNVSTLKEIDTVVLSYETEKFELSSIYSLTSPKLLETEDLEIFDKLDKLYDNSKVLKTSIDKIEDGAKELLEGSKKLESGSSLLYENLELVVENLGNIKNGAIALDEGLTNILKELEKVNQELESGMSEESIQNLEKLIATNVATIEKLTKTNTELKTAYETYHLKDMTYEEALKTDITLYNVKMNYENMYESNTQLIVLLTTNNQALEETLTSIKGMQQKVEQLIKTLNVYLGQLESGAKSLSDGTDKLKEGVTIITSKTEELKNGTTELKSGIDTLQKGVHEFNKDGITPITQFLDNDVREVTNKIEVLMKLSEEYQTFTLKPDKVNGNTRFVSVIDSITIPKEIKKVEKKQEKESFWDRVKNLFK